MNKVPKLRFKEFSGEWEEKRLGEIFEISKAKYNPLKEIKEYPCIELESLSQETGKILKTFNSLEQKSIKNKFIKGEVLFGKLRPYLKKYLYSEFDGVCSSEIWVFNSKINSNKFIYYFIQGENFIALANTTSGTKMPRADWNLMKNEYFYIPFLQEQEKIGNFLSSVDKKISIVEEKLNLFNQYKKGIMQKIFNQELRFKDENGNNYPEWEEKKLEKIADCLDNKRKPLNSTEREKIKGNIPYYGANGIQGYINNFLFDEELVLLAEDGGNFEDFSIKPIAQYICGKSWVNNHAHILKGKKETLTKFLFYSLVHKDIRNFINGTSRSKLNKSDMLNIIINLPCIEEQQKIADFLSAIDDKIENISSNLESLKLFKKSMLQKMFV